LNRNLFNENNDLTPRNDFDLAFLFFQQ